MNAMIALAAGIQALAVGAAAEEPVYPVKVSSTGRYFVDQRDRPVFWLGTTQWQLFRDNTPEEANVILANVKDKGFSFVQVMLAGVGDGTRPSAGGHKPWINNDPLRPNEAYFRNVDAVLASARKHNVNISLTLYHQRWRKLITERNARAWALWLAKRYKDVPTVVWSMTPEARKEFVPVLRELAAGLKEGDGGAHLITFKPDPAPYSSSFLHKERWLAFDCMQVWKSIHLIYPMVTKDYHLKPVKPVVMAEGAYEAGTEYGFDVTPLWVRREAWYSYLCGAHHTYGHNDSWRMLPTWRKSLDAAGGRTKGNVLNLAARHADGKWVLAYLAAKATFTIRLGKLTAGGRARASWIDPRTGNSIPAGSFPSKGTQEFTTPEGWEDAVLVLEPSP